MGLQHEPGTQFPLRPARITLLANDAGPFSAPRDAAPVDWTAAGTAIDVDTADEFFDDGQHLTPNATGDDLDVRPGVYEVLIEANVVNTDGTNDETVRAAVTNAAGTTVYFETLDISVASGTERVIQARGIVHVPVAAGVGTIKVRFAQISDTGGADDIDIADNAVVATVTRIGNGDETGQ